MKKIIIISAVVAVIVLSWGKIHNFLTAPPDFASLHKEKVILYATSWCPNCAQTRKFLKSANVPYFEYDVDNSSEGQRQFKQLHGTGVPVILIKNTVVHGYNPKAIMAAIKAHKILP
ncbi:glutaredoxin family protein [Kaarinaea lacus]